MAQSPAAKRARGNTAGEPLEILSSPSPGPVEEAPQPDPLETELQTLLSGESSDNVPKGTILDMLLKAAQEHPDVRAEVTRATQAMEEKIKNRVINFDWISKSVWREINVTHSKSRGSAQFEASFEVFSYVESSIRSIVSQCEHANFKTRYNGISTLRKIGKTICMSSNDVVGHEVLKNFYGNHMLEDGMVKILNPMTDEEIWDIYQESGSEAFLPKVKELQELASGYCIFDKLSAVIDVFSFDWGDDNAEADQAEGDQGQDGEGHEQD